MFPQPLSSSPRTAIPGASREVPLARASERLPAPQRSQSCCLDPGALARRRDGQQLARATRPGRAQLGPRTQCPRVHGHHRICCHLAGAGQGRCDQRRVGRGPAVQKGAPALTPGVCRVPPTISASASRLPAPGIWDSADTSPSLFSHYCECLVGFVEEELARRCRLPQYLWPQEFYTAASA